LGVKRSHFAFSCDIQKRRRETKTPGSKARNAKREGVKRKDCPSGNRFQIKITKSFSSELLQQRGKANEEQQRWEVGKRKKGLMERE